MSKDSEFEKLMLESDRKYAEEQKRVPKAVAAMEKGKYVPEVMVMGANYIVGVPVDTREQALALAEIEVEYIQKHIDDILEARIKSYGWKKAKA